MTKRLSIGVIGLGRKWQDRYKPALVALQNRFVVRGVFDQVQETAEKEAAQLRSRAMAGPTELVEDKDLEAVLCIDRQWFGLWPIGVACRRKLPVFSAVSPAIDDDHADAIYQQVQDSELPVMVEMLPRVAPAATRIQELLKGELGPPRFLLCDSVLPLRESSGKEGGHVSGWGLSMVDWCARLVGAQPVAVTATVGKGGAWESQIWEFAQGQGVQIVFRRGRGSGPCAQLHVTAEHGLAVVRFPRHVSWTSTTGSHRQSLPQPAPVGQLLLENFYRCVREGQTLEPSLAEAFAVLRWLRSAQRSVSQERRVETASS
jgi:predicted dehydrogenase